MDKLTELCLFSNEKAEKSLLNHIINYAKFEQFQERLKIQHFYNPKNKNIYKKTCEIYQNFEINEKIEINISAYEDHETILEIMQSENMNPELAFKLLDESLKIRLYFTIIKKTVQSIDDGFLEAPECSIKALNDVFNEFISEFKEESMPELGLRSIDRWQKKETKQYKTGIPAIDEHLVLTGGCSCYIVAPPKVGKTWFLTNFACQLSYQGFNVLFLSAEMQSDSVYDRIYSYVTDLQPIKFQNPNYIKTNASKIAESYDLVNKLNIKIVGCAGIQFQQLTGIINRSLKKYDCVILDYIQRIVNPDAKDTRISVLETSRFLSSMAVKNGKLFVIASQANTNRQERSKNAITEAHNAKESGSIEEDADAIIALTDITDYAQKKDFNDIVVKITQRNGATGLVKLEFNPINGHYIKKGDFDL